MQELIASYLFQNKTCPLPGLGTLSIQSAAAESDITIHQIAAPVPMIRFNDAVINISGLLNYIAVKSNSNDPAAALYSFCNDLKNQISQNAWAKLEGIGNFIVDNNGNTIFEQFSLPPEFLQPVFAERVIHPKSEHSILVGDKETTNKLMTEYFNEAPAKKFRWWIWAIVLGALALLILLLYFTGTKNASAFGNVIKI